MHNLTSQSKKQTMANNTNFLLASLSLSFYKYVFFFKLFFCTVFLFPIITSKICFPQNCQGNIKPFFSLTFHNLPAEEIAENFE